VPQLLNRGEQTMRAVTGSGGRLHFGMVAGIKSERWPTSNRNPWPDCVGIRSSKCGELPDLHEAIEAGLEENLSIESHIAAKDGGAPVLDKCPECLKKTYVFAEERCLNPGCEFSLEGYECAVCSEQLTLDD
jgi:hypothetical protein